ncbi:MAG: hypothetical protein ACXVJD_00390 [Mucilaginibacter sp.]
MKTRNSILILLVILFACGFIPATKSATLKINAPFYEVYRQLVSPKNWMRWQPDLNRTRSNNIRSDSTQTGVRISTPAITFKVGRDGLGGFQIIKTKNGKDYNFNYILVPDDPENRTTVLTVIKTNIFGRIWSGLTGDTQQSPVTELKKYIEDTQLYYGFVIKKELSPEKLIAVLRGDFLKKDLYPQRNMMLSRLHRFASQNKLEQLYPLQLQYVSETNDSVQIMLGLPVNKKVAVSDHAAYMTMPRGKILIGYFNGPYKYKDRLYNAMRKYMNDNYIHPMIQPFERYKGDKLPSGQDSMTDMQVIIPYM